jgi:hypothetical protein
VPASITPLEEDWNVNHVTRPWRRPVLRVLLLALAVALAPLPALAEETPANPPGPIQASIQKVVASQVVVLTKAPSAQSNQAGASATDLGSKSFFKTKAGIITLLVTAVGIGATVYSTSNDRVKSPGK